MLSYFDQYCFTKRSGSPQIPRSIPGQGFRSTRYPDFAGFPFSSNTSASTPGNGSVADPGLRTVMAGSGGGGGWPGPAGRPGGPDGALPPRRSFQYSAPAP